MSLRIIPAVIRAVIMLETLHTMISQWGSKFHYPSYTVDKFVYHYWIYIYIYIIRNCPINITQIDSDISHKNTWIDFVYIVKYWFHGRVKTACVIARVTIHSLNNTGSIIFNNIYPNIFEITFWTFLYFFFYFQIIPVKGMYAIVVANWQFIHAVMIDQYWK